jgi:hypothetical protein
MGLVQRCAHIQAGRAQLGELPDKFRALGGDEGQLGTDRGKGSADIASVAVGVEIL